MTLCPRIAAALHPRGPLELDEERVTVEVDSVERRYRDAIKAGAHPIAAPHDHVGMGAWRRVARLHDPLVNRTILIWSSRN